MTVCRKVISSTTPIWPLTTSMESPTLNGLNIKIKMPPMMLAKAFWEANPMMAASTPALAKSAVPKDLK